MATEIGRGTIPIGFDKAKIESDARAAILPGLQRVAGDAALLFVGKKIFDFAKSGVEVLEQSQRITAQTEAQLRATGGAAGVTAKDIEGLSASMRDLAGFDDEAARSAANVLLRFSNIQGSDTFKRVEKDAGDLAVTMGTDLPAAAQTLGQILQTPETAARKLRPIIGALSDAQQASVKAFIDQGDAAGAVNLILDDLEGKIGGTAESFGKTLPGQVAKSAAAMKEAKEELVAGLLPAIKLGATVTEGFADAIGKVPEPLRGVVGATLLLGGGVLALARPVNDVVRLFERFHTSAQATAEAENVLSASQAANTEVIFSNSGALAAQTAAQEAAVLAAQADADAQVELNAAFLRSEASAIAAAGGTAIAAESEALLATNSGAAVASLYEVTAAETGLAAAGAGASIALGPVAALAVGAGVLASALGFVSRGEHNAAVDSADFTQALRGQNGVLDDNVDKVSANALSHDKSARDAAAAGISYKTLFDVVRAGSDDFGGLKRQLDQSPITAGKLGDDLRHAGAGATEFGRELIAAANAGTLTREQVLGLLDTLEGLHNKFVDQKTAADAERVALGGVSGALDQNTSDTLTNAGAQKTLTDALQAQEQERSNRLDSVKNLFTAEQSETQAEHGLAQAQRGVTDAQRGVEDANRRVEDSYRSLTDAEERLTDAQTALAKAQQPADAETLGKAQLGLAEAHNRVGDAQSAVTAAERAAADARKDGKHTAAEVADLDRKVEEAKNAVTAAVFAETDAETALQQVQAKGTDQDEAVIAAQKAVDDATRGVEDANRQLTDSYQGVDDAQQRVIDAKDAVGGALLTVAEASAHLRDAQDELFTGTHSATNELYNQSSALDAITGRLDPNSPLRKNLADFIGNLAVLRDIFTMGPNEVFDGPRTAPGRDVTVRDSGGALGPRQLFQKVKGGPELLVENRLYQGPDVPSMVLNDQQTRAVFAGSGAGSNNKPSIVWTGDVINPAPEPASGSVGHELSILADRLAMMG